MVPRAAFVPPVPDMAVLAQRMADMETGLVGKASTTALTMVAQTVPALAASAPKAILQDGATGSAVRAAREDHTHELRFKRARLTTDKAGVVKVTWKEPFGVEPVMNLPVVLDPLGGKYSATLLVNGTTGCTFQINKARSLPTVIALLSALVNYDTWIAAPAGLTVHVAGAEPTE